MTSLQLNMTSRNFNHLCRHASATNKTCWSTKYYPKNK